MVISKLTSPLEVFIEFPRKRQALPIRLVASIHPALPNIIAQLQVRTFYKSRKLDKSDHSSFKLLKIAERDVDRIYREVSVNGYSILTDAIPPEVLKSLISAVQSTVVIERTTSETPYRGKIDGRPHSIGRYDVEGSELLKNKAIRDFSFSNDWKQLGEKLLKQKIVWDGVDSWWMYQSTPESASFNAQAFHSDRERLAFIKFFVYLTDIDLTTGPHVYAKGTHKKRPLALRGDRRYSDSELAEKGIEIEPICGPAGTIVIANTQGLHKGVPPHEGKGGRLLFQIQIANSLRGFERYIDPIISEEKDVQAAYVSDPKYFEELRFKL